MVVKQTCIGASTYYLRIYVRLFVYVGFGHPSQLPNLGNLPASQPPSERSLSDALRRPIFFFFFFLLLFYFSYTVD